MTNEKRPRRKVEVGPYMVGKLHVGDVVQCPDGFRFVPTYGCKRPRQLAARTPGQCVPRWARTFAAGIKGYKPDES